MQLIQHLSQGSYSEPMVEGIRLYVTYNKSDIEFLLTQSPHLGLMLETVEDLQIQIMKIKRMSDPSLVIVHNCKAQTPWGFLDGLRLFLKNEGLTIKNDWRREND